MSSVETKTNPGATTYSPFWALLIVLLSFLAMQALYVKSAFEQRGQLRASLVEINSLVSHATTVERILEGVGRDLAEMAPRNTEAGKIVKEFQIRVNNPTPSAAAPVPAPKK